MEPNTFWKNSGYNYLDFLNLKLDQLLVIINGMSRLDIIEWLSWNDPNGIYDDSQSLKELGNILSRPEAIEVLIRQIDENRI